MESFVIFDLEFTTWEGCHPDNWNPAKNQYREIVQIGACKVDAQSGEVIETFETCTQPILNPELSEYFMNLTGVSQSDLTEAPSIEQGLRLFAEWTDDLMCFSWGNDFDIVSENIQLHQLDLPFEPQRFFDMRAYFLLHGIPAHEYNSGRMYQYFGIDMDNNEHNALHDVLSVANSFAALQKRLSKKEL